MSTQSVLPKNNARAFLLVKFFLLLSGFVTKANGIFVPINQKWFNLNHQQSMYVPLSFFLASLFIASLAGGMIDRLGFRKGILAALAMSSLGCASAVFSHLTGHYFLFLAAIFLIGAGIKSLLVAGGSYSMVVGPENNQSSRLSLGQAFYSVGSLLAPIVLTLVIVFCPFLPQHVVWLSFGFFALLAIVIFFQIVFIPSLPLREGFATEENRQKKFFPKLTKTLLLSFFAMFMYMGLEVCLDSTLVKYLTDPNGKALPLDFSIALFCLYYVGFVIGRFLGSRFLHKIPLYRILLIYIPATIAMLAIGITASGIVSICALLLTGLTNSILYPTLIAMAVEEENEAPAKVTGFITMAAVGGALLPVLQGMIADAFTLRFSFTLLFFPCLWMIGHGLYIRKKHLAATTADSL